MEILRKKENQYESQLISLDEEIQSENPQADRINVLLAQLEDKWGKLTVIDKEVFQLLENGSEIRFICVFKRIRRSREV